MEAIAHCSIIICGIVRNCARGLNRNIPIVNKLCNMAKDYHVVIFNYYCPLNIGCPIPTHCNTGAGMPFC